MRNPDRIDKFCNELAKYWHMVPDWRFGQLISNVLGQECKKDIFFPEEPEMLGYFENFFKDFK